MKRAGTSRFAPRGRLISLAIAALVIIVPILVTYYAFNRGIPFVGKYTDYAIVSNSVNVRSGSPVRIVVRRASCAQGGGRR